MLMPRAIPDVIMGLMAAKFQMLADPIRLAILRTLLQKGEHNVGRGFGRICGGMVNGPGICCPRTPPGRPARAPRSPSVVAHGAP
jgi:hypothetical protein